MENFNTWSILVEQHQPNEVLVEQIAQLANQFIPKQIHFLLLDSKEDLPKELLADLPDLVETEASERYRTFQSLVQEKFHPDHRIQVQQVSRVKIGHLLKAIAELKTELLILSNDKQSELKTLTLKVARKTGASVLMLDPNDRLVWEQIVLPVDFSVYSLLATRVAKQIQLAKEMDPELQFIHVYEDGSRYLNQVFETVDEVNIALKKQSLVNKKLEQYAYAKMVEYLDTNFTQPVPAKLVEHGRDKTVADVLKKELSEEPADLLIIGSKGKGKSIASLMGDTADEFVKGDQACSVLVVKQKGENKGFLKSFLA